MSTSSSDDIDERLDDILDDILEETYENIMAGQTKKERKHAYIERNREEGHNRLWNDYFDDNPTFSEPLFRRRFRMNRELFIRIVNSLSENIPFFQQRRDATGRFGFSPLQKCTAAIRMLAYGCAADTVDEYLRMAASTTLSCLHHFTAGIIQLFGDEYLRRPTTEDLKRLLDIGKKRGFPGMIGSIDCMHWEWKNCPTAWKGQYARGSGKPTIVLEAVASQDLWIWHAFFGPPGTLNDINVLHRSPVFDDIIEGRAPRLEYVVNIHKYKLAYYLTDGIYPNWATFIQSISHPRDDKEALFAKHQESTRKDVERAFGVLQSRFAVVRNPSLTMSRKKMGRIMKACIILHNMIVENERNRYIRYHIYEFEEGDVPRSSWLSFERPTNMGNIVGTRNDVRDEHINERLKKDLVENVWNKFGDQ